MLAEQGDLSGAENELEASLRLRPQTAEVHTDLGIVLARQGKLALAVTHFEEALRINPELAAAKDNLRRVQAGMTKNK